MDQYNAVADEQGVQRWGVPTRTAMEAQQEIDANEPRRLTNNNQTTQGAESGPGGSVPVKGPLNRT